VMNKWIIDMLDEKLRKSRSSLRRIPELKLLDFSRPMEVLYIRVRHMQLHLMQADE